MSLFNKQESYLGVDIGAHGIKLVEFKKTKNRPQLWTYGILDKALDVHIPQAQEKNVQDLLHEKDVRYRNNDQIESTQAPGTLQELVMKDARINEYAELLKILIKKARVQSKRVTSSLPVSHVFHTVLNLPQAKEKETDTIVKAEVAKMISRPIEEMQVVYQKVVVPEGEQKKYNMMLVTAAPKVLVAFYTAIFQRAGLQLEELETEAFALARSLVGKDSTVSMVIDMGAERTNLFIIDKGIPMTHRSLQIGGNNFDNILKNIFQINSGMVGQIKKDLSHYTDSLTIEPFLDILEPLSKEIQYSFDLYLRQSGNEGKHPEKIIFTGGSALFPPITSYVAQQFPLKIFVGDPWARVIYQDGLKQNLDEIGPRMSVSIGLALRNFI